MSPHRHDETQPPFSIGDQTKVRMPLLMLLGLLGVVASATIAWSTLRATGEDHTAQLVAHDARITKLEANQADIAVMRNDVMWIRKTLEARDRRP